MKIIIDLALPNMSSLGRTGADEVDFERIERLERKIRQGDLLALNRRGHMSELRAGDAKVLLGRIWPDLLAGKSFSQYTIMPLSRFCKETLIDMVMEAFPNNTNFEALYAFTSKKHPICKILEGDKKPYPSEYIRLLQYIEGFRKELTELYDMHTVLRQSRRTGLFFEKIPFDVFQNSLRESIVGHAWGDGEFLAEVLRRCPSFSSELSSSTTTTGCSGGLITINL